MSGNRLDLHAIRAFGEFRLDVALNLVVDGITAVFGPSGGGKSTLLRIIAGLDQGASGHVRWNNRTWADSASGVFAPAHRRPVGMVFQDGRLFPHLDVRGNLRYAQRRAGRAGPNVGVDDVIDAFDLEPLLTRSTETLSGGERQRVAVARALLVRPELLLLDEPLSALDVGRKAAILHYLADVPKRFGTPALYVSHAVEEIAQLADQIVVLADGALAASGPTVDVLGRIDLQHLTGRFEAGAILTATVQHHDAETSLTHLAIGGQTLFMPALHALPRSTPVRLRVRARDVAIATTAPASISIRNVVACKIAAITEEPETAFAEIDLTLEGQTLRARITRAAVRDLALGPGREVYALIKSASFDRRGLLGRPEPRA